MKTMSDTTEQLPLYADHADLRTELPSPSDLCLAHNLGSIFENCHNFIYANQGLLTRISHKIVS